MSAVKLDMAPADVHIGGAMAAHRQLVEAQGGKAKPKGKKRKAAPAPPKKTKRMRGKLRMTVTHPSGHSVTVTHLTDEFDGVAVLPGILLETEAL